MNKNSVQLNRGVAVFFLLVGVIFAGSAHPGRVLAAHSTVPSGITISPITQNLQLPHAQPQLGTDISVTNNTPSPVTLKARVVDFDSLDETGGILFAGSNESSLTAKFGLFRWTSLDKPTLNLAPGEKQNVHIIVNNSRALSPGGHYGAVLFQLSGIAGSGKSEVSLNQVVTSLVFVSKLGGEVYDLQLMHPGTRLFWATLPGKVTLRFFAAGNEYMVPRGTVTVYDPFRKVAARGVINESSNIILPQTHRLYPVDLSRSASSLLPGHYTVKVLYRYDGENQFSELTYGFWVINLEGIVVLFVVLAVLMAAYLRRRPIGRALGRLAEGLVRFFSRAG